MDVPIFINHLDPDLTQTTDQKSQARFFCKDRHLVYNAAWRKDNNLDVIKEAAMAKLFSSESAMSICTEAIQVLGGFGYIHEYDVERFFRDAKILEIGEGTSEIQRIIIAREILKLYQPNE